MHQEEKEESKCDDAEITEGRGTDLPGGPVVKNPPSNAGDVGLIPGWGTKIPHAMGKAHVPKRRPNIAK